MPQKKGPQSQDSNSKKNESSNQHNEGAPFSMSKRRALVVGIDDYQGTWNDLSSCVKDAESFKDFLNHNLGFTEIKLLKDKEATLTNVVSGLDWLVEEAGPQDRLVFFYSGHGATRPNGNVMQEYLNLYDDLLDDEELVNRTRDLPQGVFTSIIDCCFSGGIEKRRYEAVLQGALEANSGFKSTNRPGGLSIDRAKVKTFVSDPKQLRALEEAELKATFYKPFGQVAKLTPSGYRKTVGTRLDELNHSLINGTIITSCLVDETAVSSTASTNGLSAFTYALLKVCENRGMILPLAELMGEITMELRMLGLRQTPRIYVKPEVMGRRTLMNLDHVFTGRTLNEEAHAYEGNIPFDTQSHPWREEMYNQFNQFNQHGHYNQFEPGYYTGFAGQEIDYLRRQPMQGFSNWSTGWNTPQMTWNMQYRPTTFFGQQLPMQHQTLSTNLIESMDRIFHHIIMTLPIEYRESLYPVIWNVLPRIMDRVVRQFPIHNQYGLLPVHRQQIELTVVNTMLPLLEVIVREVLPQRHVHSQMNHLQNQYGQFGQFSENLHRHQPLEQIISMVVPVVLETIEREHSILAQQGMSFNPEIINRISQQIISNLSPMAPVHTLQSIVPPVVEGICRQHCLISGQSQVPATTSGVRTRTSALV